MIKILQGDCIEVMKTMDPESVLVEIIDGEIIEIASIEGEK